MTTATQNTPIKSFRISNVSVSIFENEVERDGQTRRFSNVKLEKGYRDRSGAWKSTNSFSLDELLRLRLLIDKSIDCLVEHPQSTNAT